MNRLFKHLSYHRETYLFLPLFVLLCVGAIYGVNWLTGRSVTDDPAAIVGFLYNAVGAVVAVVLTGLTQQHLVGFRSEKAGASLTDDIYDACVSVFLLCFFAFVLWH